MCCVVWSDVRSSRNGKPLLWSSQECLLWIEDESEVKVLHFTIELSLGSSHLQLKSSLARPLTHAPSLTYLKPLICRRDTRHASFMMTQ